MSLIDTYDKCISHTGNSFVIFGYNGRDGVVTDKNGLIYMRARYYSPDMKRFINADIVPGQINNAVTLNRYAYANANPAMFTDPMGLSSCPLCGGAGCGVCNDIAAKSGSQASSNSSGVSRYKPNQNNKPSNSWDDDENGEVVSKDEYYGVVDVQNKIPQTRLEEADDLEINAITAKELESTENAVSVAYSIVDVGKDLMAEYGEYTIKNSVRPNNIGAGIYFRMQNAELQSFVKGMKVASVAFTVLDVGTTVVFTGLGVAYEYNENMRNGESQEEIVSDIALGVGSGALSVATTITLAVIGSSLAPGVGTLIGLGVGLFIEGCVYFLDEHIFEY